MKTLITLILTILALHSNAATGKGAVQRRQLINAAWRFHLGDAAGADGTSFDDSKWDAVTLPHDWSSLLPVSKDAPAGNDGGYYPTGMGWYRRTLNIPKGYEGKKLWLYFEGVYQNSEVYVNGKLAGGHPYGYSSFWCDITSMAHQGDNTIAVKADNSAQKNCRWYSGSGIYRNVWLFATDMIHIDMWGIRVTTPDTHTVEVATTVVNETSEQRDITVSTRLSDGTSGQQTVSVAAGGRCEVVQRLNVDTPRLWSVDTPNLYTATVSLSTGDTAEETFGIRTIEYSADKGFMLNGQSMLLNGGCVHHDNGILGAAAFDRAEERKAEMLKAAGYNAVRTSHNPTSEAFLNACDRLGLLVIDEAFDGWREQKNKEDYHKLFDKWYDKDIEALVRRDRNHPSVFCWSIGNEVIERKKIEVVTTAHKLREAVRRWDTTRPVTSALAAWDSDWEIYDPLAAEHDIVGYNYMIHKAPGDHKRVPQRVMWQTESYPRDAFKNWAMTHDNSYVIGDFVWTAIDYLGESGIGRYWYEGDVAGEHYHRPLFPWHAAYCGDIDLTGWMKPIGHYRSMLWTGKEKLYMAVREPEGWNGNGKISTGLWAVWPTWESWNWQGWEGRDIEVEISSRYPKVRLYLNDKMIGEKAVDRSTQFQAIFKIPYKSGTLKVEGMENGEVKESRTLKTALAPSAIRLTADRRDIKADGQDLSFITVEVTDKDGTVVPDAALPLSYSISGPARIQAVGNADIKDLTPFTATTATTWKGRAMVVVRSTGKSGTIKLTAKRNGKTAATVTLKAK